MLIHMIAAARPNFMKIAPLYHALESTGWARPLIVHTGQHYDLNMSDIFFRDFSLPAPHIHLGAGSGSHGEQTGRVLMAYEKTLLSERPDLVIVVGDVNSTMAATLASVKLGIRVAHLEAGLRSFDRGMPEEINRIVTDALAHMLWTPSPDADENLIREGVDPDRIERVGNIMIDALEMLRSGIEKRAVYRGLGLERGGYVLATFHRPSNVDARQTLENLVRALVRISRMFPVVFPVHPRTGKRLGRWGLLPLLEAAGNIRLLEPLSYKDFMNLVMNSRMLLTDSGGIQEETTYLGIPCVTVRPNTERPVTVTMGTNRLCDPETLVAVVEKIANQGPGMWEIPELWDGQTAGRVVGAVARLRQAPKLDGQSLNPGGF